MISDRKVSKVGFIIVNLTEMRFNMKGNEVVKYVGASYFADGTHVPDLMTEEEAVKFLRLDIDGPKDPSTTLEYYRSEDRLKATRVGKKLRYLKSELLKFLEYQTQTISGDIS